MCMSSSLISSYACSKQNTEADLVPVYSLRDLRVRSPSVQSATNDLMGFRWQSWVLDQKAGIEHIKYAYEQGINAFE
jgi:hypothetical protein